MQEKQKILVADDEPEIREVLRMMLGSEGYEILEAVNAQEAVERARVLAEPGDVVILSPASASFDRFKNFMERGNAFKDLVNALE